MGTFNQSSLTLTLGIITIERWTLATSARGTIQ
jgi:hypothetical protein